MQRFFDMLVDKRRGIAAFMLALVVLCAFLMPQVNINDDMTDYLPDDSSMRAGLAIQDAEFPGARDAAVIRVMFSGGADEDDITARLFAIGGVLSVSHDPATDKGDKSLYIVYTDTAYDTPEEAALENAITAEFPGCTLANDGQADAVLPGWLVAVVLGVLLVILVAMCKSWIEPVLFILTIGCAIVLNLGSNILLGHVAATTFSIAAIIQLVLSMDYSIILMNRYRQVRGEFATPQEAMKATLRGAFTSVFSSALTTIVGLLALLFMSFSIGRDMGLVFAKGVVFSVICIFTVSPYLIVRFDSLITKTAKPTLKLRMDGIARICYKWRVATSVAFVIIFIASVALQNQTPITYHLNTENAVTNVFTPDDTVALIYKNSDETSAAELANALAADARIKDVSAIGRAYTKAELEKIMNDYALFTDMALYQANADGVLPAVTLSDFFLFINEELTPYMDIEKQSQFSRLAAFTNGEELTAAADAGSLADMFGMTEAQVAQMLKMMNVSEISPQDFALGIESLVTKNPMFKSMMDAESAARLSLLGEIIEGVVSEKLYSPEELGNLLSGEIDKDELNLLLAAYGGARLCKDGWTLSMDEMLTALSGDGYAAFMDDAARAAISSARSNYRGNEYSRMIITTALPVESDDTTRLYDDLTAMCESALSEYHLVGSSAMNHEMRGTFAGEMRLITILTIAGIFIVVALTFKSLVIPLALVLIIQSGIYITISVMGVAGTSIYYQAMLVVQCLLMGSTVDYGILFTTYYREYRLKTNPKDAMAATYNASIHTIMTSGLIMVIVTFVASILFDDPAIGKICQTISLGSLCAILLILLVLPGILSVFDARVSPGGK